MLRQRSLISYQACITIKGRYGGLETFCLKTGFSVHIWYQMKGLDELSWKMVKKFFFRSTAAILETKMAAKMGKNRVSSAQFFWKVCQWNSIFIVDFFWLKGFLGRDREFFSNFNSQFFLQGHIRTDVNLSWFLAIILHLRFFFTCYIKKLGKSSLSRSAKFCCDRFGISFMSVS